MTVNHNGIDVDEREQNIILAEYQAYIIDEMITSFDDRITWWLVDCGYGEGDIRRYRWSEIGAMERQLYVLPLVTFARQVAWSHI